LERPFQEISGNTALVAMPHFASGNENGAGFIGPTAGETTAAAFAFAVEAEWRKRAAWFRRSRKRGPKGNAETASSRETAKRCRYPAKLSGAASRRYVPFGQNSRKPSA